MAGYEGYSALRVRVERGVAWVTIDHPPINLFDLALFLDIGRFVVDVEQDPDVSVMVFESADPEFFIAHADVNWILELPPTPPSKVQQPNAFVQLLERIRRMPKVSIGALAGIARGGGSEFLLSLDMRFAARAKAVLSQPEVALGIIPGGSGTQRLARLVGRSRALEIVLGCGDVRADEAAAIGYVNRVLPDDQLMPFVRELAERIAAMPAEAVRLAKESVDHALPSPEPGLIAESQRFEESVALPEARQRMRAFLEGGGQTREFELSLGRWISDGERRG
jgi:enoyl-CoA hydratase/carnithine racemase